MIDEKFSALAFSDAGFGTEEARALSRQLQEAIVQQLSLTVGKELEAVIARLNFLGHHLEPFGLQTADARHFRERHNDKSQPFKFLVALDLIATVGYPHTTDK